MNLTKLYKRNTNGKVQEWLIEVEGNKFRTISGQVDGKKVTSNWTECFGKNIGKANETTAEEQALLEATSKWQRKKENHYFESLENIDVQNFEKPMLAQKYEDRKDLINMRAGVFSQPKLDGVRCVMSRHGMFTRNGKPIISVPHIFENAKHLFEQNPDLILDGELYNDDLNDDFNRIISLVKKTKPTAEDLKESEIMQFWVYDVITDAPFMERSMFLQELIAEIDILVFTPTSLVADWDHLDDLYGEYLAAGFEGQMVRMGDKMYENKRSKFLLKRKEFVDEEFTIISLNEGKGNYAGMIKSMTVTDGDVTFDSGIKGNQDFLKRLMGRDDLIGKEVTIRYQNRTPDRVPRFPVVYVIHETERW